MASQMNCQRFMDARFKNGVSMPALSYMSRHRQGNIPSEHFGNSPEQTQLPIRDCRLVKRGDVLEGTPPAVCSVLVDANA